MSEYGKSMNQESFGYKSENFPDEESTNMCPDIGFNSELSLNVGDFIDGDVKCSTRVLQGEESVPECSIGTYIPKDRPNLAEQFKAMKKDYNKKIRKQSKDHKNEIRKQSKDYNKKIREMKKNSSILALCDLKNFAVQLAYFLEMEVLLPNVPEAEKFRDQELKFSNVNTLFTNEADCSKLKLKEKFIELNNITENNSIFRRIRRSRNASVHPEVLNLEKVKILQDILRNGSCLDEESQVELTEVNSLIKDLIGYGEANSLL